MNQPLSSIMSEDWAAALAPVEEQIHAMGAFLREEHTAGYRTFPPAAAAGVGRIFPRALSVRWRRVTSRWWVCCGARMHASAHPCCSRTRAWSRRILRRCLLIVVSLVRARFRP